MRRHGDGGSGIRDAGGVRVDSGAMGDGAVADAAATDAGSEIDGGSRTDAGAATSDGGITTPDAGGLDAGLTLDGGAVAAVAFRMLSLNLHCLSVERTAHRTNEERVAAIVDLVVARHIDVMVLQEACDDGSLDVTEALVAGLMARTSDTWSSAWAHAHTAWAGTPEEAEEGLAILVRGDIRDPETLVYRAQGGLRRVGLAATLPAALGRLRVVSMHLDHQDAAIRGAQAVETAASAQASADLLGGAGAAGVIVAGDLNDRMATNPHRAFGTFGYLDATAALTSTRIDHVFVHRAAPCRTRDPSLVFDTAATAVSDHPGIVLDVLPASAPAVVVTRIASAVDVGPDHFLSVRGDVAPLDWTTGIPLHPRAGRWHFVTTEIVRGFAFKLLRDDMEWQTGANVVGRAGEDHAVSPAF